MSRRSVVLFCDHTVTLSGGEIALLNLIRHLNRERYEPVAALFAEGPLGQRLMEEGVEVHRIDLDPRVAAVRRSTLGTGGLIRNIMRPALVPFVARLRKLILHRGVDLVHANSLKADILSGAAARLARKPLIWHVRDRIAEDYLPRASVKAFRKLCRWVPDRVLVNSAATLATLNLPDGCSGRLRKGLGVVVHDGMEVWPEPGPPPEGDTPWVGLVGRIAPWKGQHVFLDAARRVLDAVPSAHFLIVGTTMFDEVEYERQIREQWKALGLTQAVEFAGFVEDVRSIYARLSVVVHASTTPEPFGQVVLEGMMAGRPVVATNGGGVPEIMIDGETGILVPMGDAAAMAAAIVRILTTPGLAAAMGSAGRRRAVSEFPIEKTARKVEAVYADLLRP